MPIITLDGPKLTKEQKKELIKGFTETASNVVNLPEEAFVVLIKEMEAENVGVGGELLAEKHGE
ncbi:MULTISPECIES: 4-oxalocrotonate tautomerase DmpI [unclassified Candidatus Frackibacter]|uniref:4-oxalocrotonate tautomerase DmpI n=1 Tax=unclassified Candidatus Frackibacter TaxID=2648818 RepID=UPI0007942DF4|nr:MULTISPECIES: 4-oxalocrotonate tautomerase DmpI [unclassified Candidatus Frackibacter]KXS41744.1 MAG: 4-oxalocrotonate tautomerase [Candidatus Frackibacter sp. T328-2]SDC17648.1 4-oxalocrotonate tautomerase [Candidatus Frackibacter sp. WG11]SEM44314.1 4-oxalocrotonate tautomerase [Candidatus Frackibacter sp. WG12]SFL46845.1 4-oxalocrotonate tautomerase [Candidatus Frackibacter sp. WG13]